MPLAELRRFQEWAEAAIDRYIADGSTVRVENPPSFIGEAGLKAEWGTSSRERALGSGLRPGSDALSLCCLFR